MAQAVQTRTYARRESVVFRITKERFGGLSNMASGFPLEVNGVRVWSSEALYQACRFPHLPKVQEVIVRERSPMTAKMRSKPYRKDSRPDWEKIHVTVMKWCLRVKLAQNWVTFGDLLLSTGDCPIVEESKRDKFWAAEPLDDGTLVGGNVLGRLLMELREELRGPNKQLLKRVEPPNIPNFCLLGNPIGAIDLTQDIEAKDSTLSTASMEVSDTSSSIENTRSVHQAELQSPIERTNFELKPKEVSSPRNGIPQECKRLAEVDFPVAEVSKHSAREKSIRHGHPSTLHLWWARRPLAACRAMLMALLLPDPCDQHCPADFKVQARRLLAPVPMISLGPDDEGLRKALLKFIADFSNWDNSASQTYLECAQGLVKAAHDNEVPLVVDPFAGGGSIPLEALRIGCDTFSSDLNPVACLILKVLLEHIPRYGLGLADELRNAGEEIREEAENELAKFYPLDANGSRPITYLWARTVRCEAPRCGAEIPLVRSFWLCKKASRKRALRYRVVRPEKHPPCVEFEVFTPKTDNEVPSGSVTRAKATCPCCNVPLSADRVCAQLKEQRGGADVIFDERGRRVGGAYLLAVVTLSETKSGRLYRAPGEHDYAAVRGAVQKLAEIASKPLLSGLNPVPDEPLPPVGTLGFRVQRYGMLQWGDLFSARQKLALVRLSDLIRNYDLKSSAVAQPVRELLALALGRNADQMSSLVSWLQTIEAVSHTFVRQALPIVWDFVEICPTVEDSANFGAALEWIAKVVESGSLPVKAAAQVSLQDARKSPLPTGASGVYFTDPPYYDAVPYADLSDFFFVWLKRILSDHPLFRYPDEPGQSLTPKSPEIVQDETKKTRDGLPKDKYYFENAMQLTFAEGRRLLEDSGIGCVVFAHKTTEGWEALLSGMIRGGWVLTSSWPITTERAVRLRARESAALSASVHLVCRPRTNGGIGGWEDILQELPPRIADWIERLSSEGIRGADLVFSCIGPSLELFSRFDKVETAEGREVKLDEFLEKVWEVVGRSALQQVLGTAEARARNGAAAALEEDARLTALFLWTLQSALKPNGDAIDEEINEEEGDEEDAPKPKKGYILIYDVVRRFAQPLGIHLEHWNGRIIETKKGIVRLIPILEREEQLFGTSGTNAVARALECTGGREPQYMLFPEEPDTAGSRKAGKGPRKERGAKREESEALAPRREATTLDRVHAAILLQARGEATALRALLQAEIQRTPDFLRLANALSALYPKDSEEKRLLDAMLLAVPR